jgi:uncharacterized protein YxeA
VGIAPHHKTNKDMKKIITISIILTTINLLVVLAMASIIREQRAYIDACNAYIDELHLDYPSYEDTTAEGDAYQDYAEYRYNMYNN